MNCLNFSCILFICVSALTLYGQQQVDSVTLPVKLEQTVSLQKPLYVVGASALIPGAGQFYTKQYLKSGVFLALEATTVSFALGWRQIARSRERNYHLILNSVSKDDTGFVLAGKMEVASGQKHETFGAEFKSYNALTWTAGMYIYNLLDAFEATGLFQDTKKRNPRIAFGLSAIPALGLGQAYNGSYSKAGLVMMTQVSLGVLAWNNHRLMVHAESNFERVSDTTVTLLAIKTRYRTDWDGKRRIALQNRNMYLWYSIFTYIVGMLDAVVDAHLHDYQDKMRIEPDLVPHSSGAGINLNINF